MSRRKSSSKQKPGITKGEAKRGATTPPQAPQLHREDAALWAEVTKSLTPLKRDHDRLHFGPLLDEKPDMTNFWPPAPENAGDQGADAWNNGKRAQKQPSVAGLEMPRQGTPIDHLQVDNQFTRRDMRRISSGRQTIEARLDLHGLRQAAAHVALQGFLRKSQQNGLRHVLVITGKGQSAPSDEVFFQEREQGVLRRMVPIWLDEPDLRSIVSGFTNAPRRHGGEGALYIRLRRNRGQR